MLETLKNNYLEYFCEALGLGTFMVSAGVFSVLLFHPASIAGGWNQQLRLALIGLAMGLTAIAIFKSPFGKLSGAHINPAVTAVFWRLGKIKSVDAVFYILFQFIGATGGVLLSWLWLGERLAQRDVNFAVTVPGEAGWPTAFAAEFLISCGMMMMVLTTANHAKFARLTPYLAGLLIALYISLEAPISGMSMNPARTFGSALAADVWNGWWIYFTAPPLGMLCAAEIYVRSNDARAVFCAKFDHYSKMRCIFNCRFGELEKMGKK